MTRVIVIPVTGDPREETIGKKDALKDFQKIVGGNITLCPIQMKTINDLELTIYANDEGMLISLPVNQNLAKAYPSYPFFGNVILVAYDPKTGDEVSVPTQIKPDNWATFIDTE